jgi:hypothetical protein
MNKALTDVRYLLLLFMLFIISGCQVKQSVPLEKKAEIAIRNFLSDQAFRENRKSDTIYLLNVMKVDSVSEMPFHLRKLDRVFNLYKSSVALYKAGVNVADVKVQQYKLSRVMFGGNTLMDMDKKDATDELNKAAKIKEQAEYYKSVYDSLEQIKIDTSKKDFYAARVFLKATIDKKNYLDTLNYFFTKDWKLVNPFKDLNLQEFDPE